ncbi:unnamed protein product [Protopolystoma xenopodis]|uniref:Uncharacterized protein n=1 Tax=Protopolystoma xenopodis TaxID=117903 RepID=A0A3S5CVP9_9PLAT|nr:unnamed protein product [Protopolystoma xenopodis]
MKIRLEGIRKLATSDTERRRRDFDVGSPSRHFDDSVLFLNQSPSIPVKKW